MLTPTEITESIVGLLFFLVVMMGIAVTPYFLLIYFMCMEKRDDKKPRL